MKRKAELKQHILIKHGTQQLNALGVKKLPDNLNKLNALNGELNDRFGHNNKPSRLDRLRAWVERVGKEA